LANRAVPVFFGDAVGVAGGVGDADSDGDVGDANLRTVANGRYTLEANGNPAAEFRKGENPGDDKEAWANRVNVLLNVKCHCVPGQTWTG
jgi:hypothetical protein